MQRNRILCNKHLRRHFQNPFPEFPCIINYRLIGFIIRLSYLWTLFPRIVNYSAWRIIKRVQGSLYFTYGKFESTIITINNHNQLRIVFIVVQVYVFQQCLQLYILNILLLFNTYIFYFCGLINHSEHIW